MVDFNWPVVPRVVPVAGREVRQECGGAGVAHGAPVGGTRRDHFVVFAHPGDDAVRPRRNFDVVVGRRLVEAVVGHALDVDRVAQALALEVDALVAGVARHLPRLVEHPLAAAGTVVALQPVATPDAEVGHVVDIFVGRVLEVLVEAALDDVRPVRLVAERRRDVVTPHVGELNVLGELRSGKGLFEVPVLAVPVDEIERDAVFDGPLDLPVEDFGLVVGVPAESGTAFRRGAPDLEPVVGARPVREVEGADFARHGLDGLRLGDVGEILRKPERRSDFNGHLRDGGGCVAVGKDNARREGARFVREDSHAVQHRVATAEVGKAEGLVRVDNEHPGWQPLHAHRHAGCGDGSRVEDADLDVHGASRAVELHRRLRV